jgi:hypothetical protein
MKPMKTKEPGSNLLGLPGFSDLKSEKHPLIQTTTDLKSEVVEMFCPKCGHGSYLIKGKIEHRCY